MNLITTNRNRQRMTRCGFTLLASFLLSGTAWAGDAETIADLQARLATVEKNVDQLVENESKDSPAVGIPLHGFFDVGLTHASNNETRIDQAGRGFWANALDFYLTPQFTDNSKALVELIFEFAPDGGLATDLERIQYGYTFSDQLTTWMGRFHAPYGYWNTGFHHGAQIQTSIMRPRFIDFEDKGGLLPSHVMGAWATGAAAIGNSRLIYDVYVGNGNAMNIDTTSIPMTDPDPTHTGSLDINNARDSNGNKLFGANIAYKTGGLVLGTHGFTEHVTLRDADTNSPVTGEIKVTMSGLYGFYENDSLEAIAEYYHFKNDDLTPAETGVHSSQLAFAQVGYTLAGVWTPYARGEKASLNQKDPYFNNQQYGVSYTRQVLGMRYMLNTKAALKLEANRTKEGDGVSISGPENGKYREVRAQYSVRF